MGAFYTYSMAYNMKSIKRFLLQKKYQPHRLVIVSVIISLLLAGLFQNDISKMYIKFKYRNEPLTINVLTLIRDNSQDYWNLSSLKEEPLRLEILGTNYSTDDMNAFLIIQNVNRIGLDGDRANLIGNYCLFSFPIKIKTKKFSTLQVGQSFDFEGFNCSKCIENTIFIKHFGEKPINNFFARLCVDGIIKDIQGNSIKKDGLHCIEIEKLRFNFGEDITGKFSVINYKDSDIMVSFNAVSDEQGKISDYNFVHTGALLKSNCEAKNVVTKRCWGSWLAEKIHKCS